jgi:hypothetical protein
VLRKEAAVKSPPHGALASRAPARTGEQLPRGSLQGRSGIQKRLTHQIAQHALGQAVAEGLQSAANPLQQAPPMLGDIDSALLMELIVFRALFAYWRRRGLPK